MFATILALTLLLGADADASPNAPTATPAPVATPTSADAKALAKAKAKAEDERLVCETVRPVGSHRAERICMTKREQREMQDQARRSVRGQVGACAASQGAPGTCRTTNTSR